MEITKASSPGGALSAMTGAWQLSKDATSGRFVRRFTLLVQTGGLAERITWKPTSQLSLVFPSFDYDALAPSAPEGATLAGSAHGVKVKFPTARTIVRVKVSSPHSSDVIEARRVVGGTIADDPFAAVPYQNEGLILNAAEQELELRRQLGELPASSVTSVTVRSAAANVRVGVGFSVLGAEQFYLPALPAAFLANPSVTTDLGPTLAELLEGISGRLVAEGKLLPATLSLTLSIESDTPTQAHISAFALRYRLQRRSFDDRVAKRVLEFPGGQLTTRDLVFGVPHGSSLSSAKLRFMGAFDRQSESKAQGGALVAKAAATSDVGVEVRSGEAIASRLTLQQAALVDGATLEVAALVEATTVRLDLRADAGGRPGDVIVSGSLPSIPAGARRVVRVDFERQGLASAGPVWLCAECKSGVLLWLTVPESAAAAASAVLRRVPGELVWSPFAAGSGAAVAALVTRSGSADGDAFHGVRLFHGSQRLLGTQPQPGAAGEDETHFEVASAIEATLLAGAAGTLVPVKIAVRSSERARVTVYPPEVEFEP